MDSFNLVSTATQQVLAQNRGQPNNHQPTQWVSCQEYSIGPQLNVLFKFQFQKGNKYKNLWFMKLKKIYRFLFQIQVASAATCSPAKTRGQTARAAQTRSKDGFDGGPKTGSKVRAKAGSQDRFWRKTRSSNGGVPRPVCLSGVGFRGLMFRLILIASGKWKEGDTSPTGIWTSWENEEHQVWKHKSKWL